METPKCILSSKVLATSLAPACPLVVVVVGSALWATSSYLVRNGYSVSGLGADSKGPGFGCGRPSQSFPSPSLHALQALYLEDLRTFAEIPSARSKS